MDAQHFVGDCMALEARNKRALSIEQQFENLSDPLIFLILLLRPGKLNSTATEASDYSLLRKVLTPKSPKVDILDIPLL